MTGSLCLPSAPSSRSSGSAYRRSRPSSASASAATTVGGSSGSSQTMRQSRLSRSASPHPPTMANAFIEAKRVFSKRLEEALVNTHLAAAARIADFVVASRRRRLLRQVAKSERDSTIARAIAKYRSDQRRLTLRRILSGYHRRMLHSPKRFAAALKIQLVWRRWHAVRRVCGMRSAQAGLALIQWQWEARHRACVAIQAWWRGTAVKRSVDLIGRRHRQEHGAVVYLQRWWRQLLARKLAHQVQRDVLHAENGAAAKIQRFMHRRWEIRGRIVEAVVRSILSSSSRSSDRLDLC
jgi:hypothetical protein